MNGQISTRRILIFESGFDDPYVQEHVDAEVADDILEFCLNELYNKQPRDDYRELLESIILFVGG